MMRFIAKIWKTSPTRGSKVITIPAAHEAKAGDEVYVTLEPTGEPKNEPPEVKP